MPAKPEANIDVLLSPETTVSDKDKERLMAVFTPQKFQGVNGYLYRITDTHKLFVNTAGYHSSNPARHMAEGKLMDVSTNRTIHKFFVIYAPDEISALLDVAKMACEHLHKTAVASSYAATTMRTDLGISGVPDNGPDNM